MRRGLGRGMGKGYRNIIGKDPRVHSQSARGMKQPQKVNMNMMRIPEPQEYGFDLTDFSSPEAFKKVLAENNLPMKAKEVKRYYTTIDGKKEFYIVYEWKGKDVNLHTGNNPITGKYSSPGQREPEPGYASYMGIKGSPKAVAKLVKSIKENTSYIKDENKHELEFIW